MAGRVESTDYWQSEDYFRIANIQVSFNDIRCMMDRDLLIGFNIVSTSKALIPYFQAFLDTAKNGMFRDATIIGVSRHKNPDSLFDYSRSWFVVIQHMLLDSVPWGGIFPIIPLAMRETERSKFNQRVRELL